MSIREKARGQFEFVGELIDLFWQTVRCSFTRPFYWHRVNEQILEIGAGSLSITVVIGVVMGLVMTLQFGYGLAKFGGTLYVPAIVALSIVREMAPIFTSLLVAGRVGSGIAAEVGAMNVTQQIDAIRALGTNPVRVLVVPRFIASIIAIPLLAVLAGFLGILGGLVIAWMEFDMSPGFYINKVLTTMKLHDVFSGYIKCIFFAMVISIIACWRGFQTKEGTRGVGEAATWVVVRSSIVILISDFFLSKALILLLE
jgi:phospholipid/cholesterol/gamma-HCH transport system permease protein